MRWLSASLLAASLLSPVLSSPDCGNILADNVHWDLRPLKGKREVYEINDKDTGDAFNTTYRFDLCNSLGKDREEGEKGCDLGSWVCGFAHQYDRETEKTDPDIADSWAIAGTFHAGGKGAGGSLDEHFERIKGSNANADEEGKEGVRLIYHGGKRMGDPARFIAEMVCDKEKQSRRRAERALRPRAKDEDEEEEDIGEPEFIKYKVEPLPGGKKDEQNWVLRIRWKTIHACEDERDKHMGGGSHWGFFTWFIIILFLLVATYLIFGSWLNYNRHGARGWDLLPHGDTIRDIPYLLKDWGRAVVDTVQGTHTRGGYNQI